MMSGRNIFLTGNAGTGKTTILREFRKRCGKGCVFLAPTGIAAINVQGTTIHSFLLLKPGLLMPDMIEVVPVVYCPVYLGIAYVVWNGDVALALRQ